MRIKEVDIDKKKNLKRIFLGGYTSTNNCRKKKSIIAQRTVY